MFFDLFLSALQSLHGGAAYGLLFTLFLLCGIGAPLGQDILLLAAATLPLQAVPLAVVAWLGLLAGDVVSVYVGHRYGARWIRRPWAARFVAPDRLPAAEAFMRRFGAAFSFVTRFLPGQRGTLFFIAGTLKLPYRTFFVWDGLAAALHVGLLVAGARSFGWRWQDLDAAFSRADDLLTGVLVVVLLVMWLRGRPRRVEERR